MYCLLGNVGGDAPAWAIDRAANRWCGESETFLYTSWGRSLTRYGKASAHSGAEHHASRGWSRELLRADGFGSRELGVPRKLRTPGLASASSSSQFLSHFTLSILWNHTFDVFLSFVINSMITIIRYNLHTRILLYLAGELHFSSLMLTPISDLVLNVNEKHIWSIGFQKLNTVGPTLFNFRNLRDQMYFFMKMRDQMWSWYKYEGLKL